MRPILSTATLGVMLLTTSAVAQTRSPEAKSQAIAASFSKFKSLSKEKHGIKKEKYLKVESEPVVLRNPANYSGKYEVPDLQMTLDLTVKPDGSVTGTGYEPISDGVMRSFVLRDGKIQGAFLSATKVYSDASQTFEGAFMNRSTYESPTDKGFTVFGFGTIGRAVHVNGYDVEKFFYQRVK